MPVTPLDKSRNTIESERLPPIVPPPATAFRHHLPNDSTSIRDYHLNNNKSSPIPTKKYIPKTMNTTTTIKKPVNGGHFMTNGTSSQSSRTTSSESDKRIRKFWWSPKRNQIEIRSENNRFPHVPSKIGSLVNIDYRPGGGHISIRDEPVQWQVTSKINSLENANWIPPPTRVTIRKEKLKWDTQPKVGSMINIDHKPTGGNVLIRDDKMDLSHITPRVDCGFVD